ncbi:TPA: DUF3037 domain-containing protein [Klebsiella pneumoniae]|nr:DUF3037 domain-containing protein [Klebsiella pneumoniae]HCD3696589.1 DUF3037 domain-containing protein [Klebsiella pneumoniae]HCD4697316.1 DUF3037 domain-containing protein [Klebsiella pneumoniae]HCD5485185.1 DUF3037 domain-containing protein [Klebsiella pneumoniae]
MTTYQYSIIRVTPNPVRAETINVGMIVMRPSGADVRVIETTAKIKAITNAFGLDALENIRSQFEKILGSGLSLEQATLFFQGKLTLSATGTFHAENDAEYNKKINELNKLYITPEKSKKKTEVTQKRIITELKDRFEAEGILGKDIRDISNHKVVQGYPLSEAEGLYAELLLKNGIYHLTETLDFRISNVRQKIGESAVKAITMNTAKTLWKDEVKTFVVFAADTTHERIHSQQLNLVGGYSDGMFNLLSDQDMARYYDHMLFAAGKSLNFIQ